MALPLLIVLAQQRRRLARDLDVQHLKLIGEAYDRCDVVLLQVRPHPTSSLGGGIRAGMEWRSRIQSAAHEQN